MSVNKKKPARASFYLNWKAELEVEQVAQEVFFFVLLVVAVVRIAVVAVVATVFVVVIVIIVVVAVARLLIHWLRLRVLLRVRSGRRYRSNGCNWTS